ncbi:hypothetical protein A3B40_04425 [Candidatus Roizmanbacteria bacterium RIFCSPLOWO2_01_FULL_37_16]|uniref:Uncharacterized protein n=1 Tax=Candidatus Roizmanbacteria bacterium RIFCSPLOWO2_01_FULL_37_16 TaxID=1802058 RepID=A0A1F7IJG9_9BACT|nr:MAG: hypothetical protein A2859_01360 [Candidatus Roizmanbacteria bacterium RIFCSPHIGHO2_01_FULL_37_16b]OGK43505.1 MAG: hypothetical protein A3B40_04425 [Candidatus Roizmanbacteria bacterium RIFCSPLOWO2_01_FULL_37_16]
MKNKKSPYGMFSGVKISEKEIDETTTSLDREVKDLIKRNNNKKRLHRLFHRSRQPRWEINKWVK